MESKTIVIIIFVLLMSIVAFTLGKLLVVVTPPSDSLIFSTPDVVYATDNLHAVNIPGITILKTQLTIQIDNTEYDKEFSNFKINMLDANIRVPYFNRTYVDNSYTGSNNIWSRNSNTGGSCRGYSGYSRAACCEVYGFERSIAYPGTNDGGIYHDYAQCFNYIYPKINITRVSIAGIQTNVTKIVNETYVTVNISEMVNKYCSFGFVYYNGVCTLPIIIENSVPDGSGILLSAKYELTNITPNIIIINNTQYYEKIVYLNGTTEYVYIKVPNETNYLLYGIIGALILFVIGLLVFRLKK